MHEIINSKTEKEQTLLKASIFDFQLFFMPYILTIDTSTSYLSLALQCNEEYLAGTIVKDSMAHAKRITIEIEKLLIKNQVDKHKLKAIAINEGPGSFTGLRVGSSVAKGLCFGLNIPLISIRGLEAYGHYVYSVKQEENIFILMDARRENYFYTHIQNGIVIVETAFASRVEINEKIVVLKEPRIVEVNREEENPMEARCFIHQVWQNFEERRFEDIISYTPNYYLNNYSKS